MGPTPESEHDSNKPTLETSFHQNTPFERIARNVTLGNMCVIRYTLFNSICLIFLLSLNPAAAQAKGSDDIHVQKRIQRLSKIAADKAKADSESAEEKKHHSSLKSSGEPGKENDDGDAEEPNPPGVTQRPKDLEKDSGDTGPVTDSEPVKTPPTTAAKGSSPTGTSKAAPSGPARPGTAEPAIIFPGK